MKGNFGIRMSHSPFQSLFLAQLVQYINLQFYLPLENSVYNTPFK